MEVNEIIRFVSDGFDRAKEGAALDTYNSIIGHPEMQTLPRKSHYPMGWIIYYALHQSAADAVAERKKLLAHYLRLEVMKPHKLHSMILTEAFRLYKDAEEGVRTAWLKGGRKAAEAAPRFSIVKFADLWNLEYIRPTDWNRKEHEGMELSSTVERLITHYTDELYSKRTPAKEEFVKIANQALVAYPGSASLFAQRAQLHELAGENDAAIEMLRNAVLASSARFHLWSRLAGLISGKEQTRLKVALLYKALCCPGQEEYKGKVHLHLAATLADGGAYPQAKWELDYVKRFYEGKGWNMPRLYTETSGRIPEATVPADPSGIYRKVERLADDFIYESLPETPVRKTYHKPSGEATDRYGRRRMNPVAWRVTDEAGVNYWFNPGRFGIDENLPADTPLRVRIFAGKIVKATFGMGSESAGGREVEA